MPKQKQDILSKSCFPDEVVADPAKSTESTVTKPKLI